MITTRVRQTISAAFAALALGLAAGGAEAAVYSGRWDPNFGGLFPNLGWKGSATFVLPDACVGMTGSFANSSPVCGGGGMQVTNAQVDLYDIANPSVILQVLNVGNAPFVNGMTIATSEGVTSLLGADTGFFHGVLGAIPEAEYNGHDYYFHLILHNDQAALFYTLDAAETPGCATTAFGPVDPTLCGFSATSAHVVFTPAIPEPTTWAMFGVGLAALWSQRRRLVAPALRGATAA
jgi:hypothetical protein